MRVLKFMVEKWPRKKVFCSDELSAVIGIEGKALGGILGAFSKRSTAPLVIKVGTVTVGWSGERFSRPKQAWALSHRLKESEIRHIKEVLQHFLLDY